MVFVEEVKTSLGVQVMIRTGCFISEGRLVGKDMIIVPMPQDTSLWYYSGLYAVSDMNFARHKPFNRADLTFPMSE
jgi:hypothetical protein